MIVEDDLKYLQGSGCSESLIRHSIAVAKKALDISDTVRISVNKSLVRQGAINHDIGRSRTQGIDHAIIGAEMARKMGFNERVIRIIERHIGAGISEDEAEKLGLPVQDYIPGTPEEIIVSYADNLARSDIIETFEESLAFFKRNLGAGHPAIGRFIRMHELIATWL